MKKILAIAFGFALLWGNLLPVLATEANVTAKDASAMAGADVMAIICAVIAIGGGIYLFFHFKNSGRK